MSRFVRCLVLLTLLASTSVLPAQSKKASRVGGTWKWVGKRNKQKEHTEFTLNIVQKGSSLTGTYSVDYFIDGEWQGEDGNQTPFRGSMRGAVGVIEFDREATVPGYTESVKYERPKDRAKIGFAAVKLANGRLHWTHSRGPAIEDVPRKAVLSRAR